MLACRLHAIMASRWLGALTGEDAAGAKFKAHTATNEKAYGKDATPERILGGAVPVPPGLEPLHQALEALSAPHAAAVTAR